MFKGAIASFGCLIALTLGLACLAAEPKPVYHWDFEPEGFRQLNGRQTSPGGGGLYVHTKNIQEGGYGGGSALRCNKELGRTQVIRMELPWPEFSMQLRFKSEQELSGAKQDSCLIFYSAHSWRRRQMQLYISKEGALALELRVATDDGKTLLKEFRLQGKPYDFKPQHWYTLRVAAKSGGSCQIWIDGILYEASENALTPADLVGFYPEAYPLLMLGCAHPADKEEKHFNGWIDDLSFWNQYLDPDALNLPLAKAPEKSSAASLADPNLMLKLGKLAPQLDGDLAEPFWQEAEWTLPFKLLDKPGALLGSYVKAEQRFVENAATAALGTDGKLLFLAVKCPVPEGVSYKLSARKDGDTIWNDDCIEFFLQPDAEQPLFYQYLVNADGWKQAFKYLDVGAADPGFATASQAKASRSSTLYSIELAIPLQELGISNIAEAKNIRFNVTRNGATSNGSSTWAAVGENFHNPARFGKLLVSTRKQILLDELSEIEAELAALPVSAELKNTVAPRFETLKAQLLEKGDEPGSWDSLNHGLLALHGALLKVSMQGRDYLLWEGSPWENAPPACQVPMSAKALDTVRLRCARNGKAIYSFAFSNLSEHAMMPRIKLLPDPLPTGLLHYNRMPKADTDAAKLAPRTRFMEALPMQNQAAQTIADPLAPLLLNSLFRCQPGQTLPLWLEIDLRGLEPGQYSAQVQVRPTYRALPAQQFKLELEILDIDLQEVELDIYTYTYLRNPAAFKVYADYGFNYLYCGTPGQGGLDIYPGFDKQGNIVEKPDFSQLDRQIDLALQAGFHPDKLKLEFFLAFDYEYWRSLMHKGKRQLEFGSEAWQKGFSAWLALLKKHLQDKYRIPLQRVVFNPEDESTGDPDDPDSPMYIALAACKAIKEADPEVRTMLNPFFDPAKIKNFEYLLKRLAEHTDIIEFYRPHIQKKPDLPQLARQAGDFEYWIYHILTKTSAPGIYRRLYWQNWLDGLSSVCAYWHFDSHAGGDGFNSFDGGKNTADYGLVYSDEASDQVIISRRLLAWYQGQMDFALFEICRRQLDLAEAAKRPVARQKAALQSLVEEGLSAGSIQLEQLHQKLLDLALELKKLNQ